MKALLQGILDGDLNGTPFDHWKDSRRSRKHTKEWESDAILHGFLGSDDGAVSFTINNKKNKSSYTCHEGTSLYGREARPGTG